MFGSGGYTGTPITPARKHPKNAGKNSAAAGLTAFVLNIVTYYDIVITVEPKRIALAEAMVADAATCADAICTLRSVSHALRHTTEGFVGITLRIVTDAARALCIDNSATSPLHTGMRTRGIGLNTRLAMVLASTKHLTLDFDTLAAFPAQQASRERVPCWQIYLRIRTVHEARSGGYGGYGGGSGRGGAGVAYGGGKSVRCARSLGILVHTPVSYTHLTLPTKA